MLEIRPGCECCDRDLPPDSRDAMICSFECTFCRDCAENVLRGICPNCGGELLRRQAGEVSGADRAHGQAGWVPRRGMTRRRLSKAEARILEQCWKLGTCSVREILESLPEDEQVAYTTVQTIVHRLEEKGALRR